MVFDEENGLIKVAPLEKIYDFVAGCPFSFETIFKLPKKNTFGFLIFETRNFINNRE